jgi:hypothetical protein
VASAEKQGTCKPGKDKSRKVYMPKNGQNTTLEVMNKIPI